jgi:MPBQ/MSBQ methyltransferase
MVEVSDLVRGHYGGAPPGEAILSALHDAGVDLAHLRVEDLAPVDQLHAHGLAATGHLLEQLDLDDRTRLLDVGCGIGGPARAAAEQYGCQVVGIDLSPDFVRVARDLTSRLGLSALVEHRTAAGDRMEFEDGSFDRAMLIHVGMNIPDKSAVFAEVRRVLRAGGLFGLYEQMRTGEGALPYPLPWAEDERSSFVATPKSYADDLRAAGFVVELTDDRVALPATAGGPSPLSPGTVFGPRFTERIANNIAAARTGLLTPVLMLARAVG